MQSKSSTLGQEIPWAMYFIKNDQSLKNINDDRMIVMKAL